MKVVIDGVTYVPLSECRTVQVNGEVYVAKDNSSAVLVDRDGDRWTPIPGSDMYTCSSVGVIDRNRAQIDADFGIVQEDA